MPMSATTPRLFPLIRQLSEPCTGLLARTPVTPNQVTAASLICGLLAAACFTRSAYGLQLTGALFFIACYVLDNCDGEIARFKDMETRFGHFFDTFSDWLVHAVLFVALGYGAYAMRENSIWLWLGVAAATGATINYLICLVSDIRNGDGRTPADPRPPSGWKENLIYVFRELMRADFCFILFVFALSGATWVLLPLAAAGAQAYWLARFYEGADKFRV